MIEKRAPKFKLRMTEAALRALPALAPGETERLAWDESVPGLALRIGRQRRSWVLIYRRPGLGRAGSPQKVGLGVWPAVTVDSARKAAQVEAGRVARGENPAAERREAKRKETSNVSTSLDLYETSLRRRKYVNAVTAMSTLRRGLSGLKARDVASLTRRELVDVIDSIEQDGRPGAAADLRRHLRTFLEWATNKGLTPFNVLAGFRRERATRAERIAAGERGRALHAAELKKVWDAATVETVFGRYVRALILTGARRAEMSRLERGMRKGDRLSLPSTHTKQGRSHEIPLTAKLAELLDACPRTRSVLYFAAPTTGREMAGWTQLVAKLREASGVQFNLHDLRRTMRTGLSALGVEHDVAELALGHQRDDLVRRYDKDDRWQARQAAAEAWEFHVLSVTADKQVTAAS